MQPYADPCSDGNSRRNINIKTTRTSKASLEKPHTEKCVGLNPSTLEGERPELAILGCDAEIFREVRQGR